MASTTGITVSNEREIQPMNLSLEQLNSLRTQHEEELQELQKQLEALHGAKGRFSNSRNVMEEMSSAEKNRSLLIPLNSSLYVPGKVVDPERVIVELGTGYFCEKTVPKAKELIDRKVAMKKKNAYEQISMIMNYKISLAQESRAQKTR